PNERHVDVEGGGVGVFRQVLEPVQVHAAANVVAQHHGRHRNGGKARFASGHEQADVGLDVGAVIGRVAHLLGLLDVGQRLLLDRQLQVVYFGKDRQQVERSDQLDRVTGDQQVHGPRGAALGDLSHLFVVASHQVASHVVEARF